MSLQSQYVIGLYRDVNPAKNRCRHNIACLFFKSKSNIFPFFFISMLRMNNSFFAFKNKNCRVYTSAPLNSLIMANLIISSILIGSFK